MRLSDMIAAFIEEEIEREGGAAELQRAKIAELFDCVPSQINYVLTSRFTPELGYIVETRRGGGGYIRIERHTGEAALLHAVNAVGDGLDAQSCRVILKNFLNSDILTENEAKLIAKAIDVAAAAVPAEDKETMRAEMLKHLLVTLCK